MRVTRRGLLLGGAAASVAMAGGVAWELAPAPGASVLSEHELRVVRALAEVMFPGAPFPVDGITAGVAEEVDRIVGEVLEPIHASGFRTLLHAVEWGTLASRGQRFSALPADDRREVLETWGDPTVFARRVAGDSFKVVLGMAYFNHPEVLAHMGWRATCGGGPS